MQMLQMYAFPTAGAVITVLVVIPATVFVMFKRRQTLAQYDNNEDESESTDTEGGGVQTGADRPKGATKGEI
jgi:hypothetical protein